MGRKELTVDIFTNHMSVKTALGPLSKIMANLKLLFAQRSKEVEKNRAKMDELTGINNAHNKEMDEARVILEKLSKLLSVEPEPTEPKEEGKD
jgi:hypothetical protein